MRPSLSYLENSGAAERSTVFCGLVWTGEGLCALL